MHIKANMLDKINSLEHEVGRNAAKSSYQSQMIKVEKIDDLAFE